MAVCVSYKYGYVAIASEIAPIKIDLEGTLTRHQSVAAGNHLI